jgi:beta-1,4-mannosyltransferase
VSSALVTEVTKLHRMPTAYFSPFVNETNDYINRMTAVVAGCGYDIQPLSFRTLLSPKALGLMRRDSIVLVHWLESRVFSEGRSGARIRPAGLFQFAVYALVLAFMRARLLYFVHDHAVHDLTGWRRGFSQRLIGLLGRLASARVVHDPSFVQRYQATYLPHPLYRERRPQALNTRSPGLPFRAGILGAVRPYKRIEHIIDLWPEGPELLIRGRSDAAYEQLLKEHIARRGPGVRINLITGFMTRDDFDAELDKLDALILPHADESALVSGAFFEAIGAVPAVVARSSPFVQWAKSEFEGVLAFASDAEFVQAIQEAVDRQNRLQTLLPQAAQRANALFGYEACVEAYRSVLRQG